MKEDRRKPRAIETVIDATSFDSIMRRALNAPPLPSEQRSTKKSKKPRKR